MTAVDTLQNKHQDNEIAAPSTAAQPKGMAFPKKLRLDGG
jgi:hypothetical protein